MRSSSTTPGRSIENGTAGTRSRWTSGKALGVQAQVDVADALGPSPVVKADITGSSDLGELGKAAGEADRPQAGHGPGGVGVDQGNGRGQRRRLGQGQAGLAIANMVAVDTKQKKRYEIDKAVDLQAAGGWDAKTKTATAETITLSSSVATIDGKGGAALAGESPVIQDSTFAAELDLEKLAGSSRCSWRTRPS
jgi:hypothetical protein